MSNSSSLTLVVPQFFAGVAFEARAPTESLLARVAGRGDLARRWHATRNNEARLLPWQRGLLAMLQLDERGYPSAPVAALGAGVARGCVDWLHAEPIHLAAGLNEVALVPLRGELELTPAERDSMTAILQAHIAVEGFELQPAATNAWLIGSPEELELETVTPTFARTSEWSVVLPQGAAAPRLRRLMTELQMLLHEHPVNAARMARGTPSVNSLWFWGNGRCAAARANGVRECMGSHDYLRGVCELNQWRPPSKAQSPQDIVERAAVSGSIVCVLDALEAARFEREWLAPLVTALQQQRLARLELVLDEWLVTIDRWRLRRFWRRPLPLQAWAAA